MQSEVKELFLYRPGKAFPAISVTGNACDLQCDYCRAHYLKGMTTVASPEDLIELAKGLEANHAGGMLISGGCDRNGKIPLGPFLPALKWIKQETRLQINLHAGLVDDSEALRIAESSVDCVSFDLIQDPDVIRGRMHLILSPEAYSKSLTSLLSSGVRRVVPHLLVGLSGEERKFEMSAIEAASRYPITGMVVLAFLPTLGTPMENCGSPSDDHLLAILRRAIDVLDVPVMLGCMRPRGNWELEVKAIELGVRRIAMPASQTVGWAKSRGYKVTKRSSCCVF